jgi:hypothetical protein
MDLIKEFLTTRGGQLIARYLTNVLVALGTYLGATVPTDDLTKVAEVSGAFVIAGVFHIIDIWSHRKQAAGESK